MRLSGQSLAITSFEEFYFIYWQIQSEAYAPGFEFRNGTAQNIKEWLKKQRALAVMALCHRDGAGFIYGLASRRGGFFMLCYEGAYGFEAFDI